MKVLKLIQGTPEWHAHRATHFNASDAPAMLGVSPYKTRAQLLREMATGVAPEIDAATQKRFDDGHYYEAMARPLAENIVGQELYPLTGVLEGTRFSASLDGVTMFEDVLFEHKSLNDELRAIMVEGFAGEELPEYHRVQMEQQCMVSGADRVLFMASKWSGGTLVEERHCWYTPDSALRARIVEGWKQFEADLAAYEPEPEAPPAPVGKSPETLPALRVEVTGSVLASNLDAFRSHAMDILGAINRDLQTDEDFASAESTVKWAKEVEDRLAATKANVLGQMESVDAVCRTIDEITRETRRIRLELDKLVKTEKEHRKADIVAAGVQAVREHYGAINLTLAGHPIPTPASVTSDIGASIKGLRTLSSMRDKVDAAVANAKIAASQQADLIRANIAILAEHKDHLTLFADRVTLCATKHSDDLRNLVAARIAEHEQREKARLDVERERIRKEEVDRLEREQEADKRKRIDAAVDAFKRIETECLVLSTDQIKDRLSTLEKAPPDNMPHEVVEAYMDAMESMRAMIRKDEQSQALTQREAPAAFGTTPPSPGALLGHTTAVRSEDRPAYKTGAKVKLGDIQAAIAPLSITAEGLAQLGFNPVAKKGAGKLYAADDFDAMLGAMLRLLERASLKEAA